MMKNTENDNRNLRSGGRHAPTVNARHGSFLSASVLNLDACPDPIGVGRSILKRCAPQRPLSMNQFSIQPLAFSIAWRSQSYSALFSVVQHYSALKKNIFFIFFGINRVGVKPLDSKGSFCSLKMKV